MAQKARANITGLVSVNGTEAVWQDTEPEPKQEACAYCGNMSDVRGSRGECPSCGAPRPRPRPPTYAKPASYPMGFPPGRLCTTDFETEISEST